MNDITRNKYRNEVENEKVHSKVYDFLHFIFSLIQWIILKKIVTFISSDVLVTFISMLWIIMNTLPFFTEKSEGTKVYITKYDNVDNDNLRHIKKLSKALLKHPHFVGKPSKFKHVHNCVLL